MKKTKLNGLSLSVISIGCLSLLLAGCEKQTASVNDANAAATPAADDSKPAVAAQVTGTGAAAQNVATNSVDQVQGVIAQAQTLVAGNKFSEAAAQLQNLASQKLSTEQQQLVDGLKQQIQQALSKLTTNGVANAVSGLIGK